MAVFNILNYLDQLTPDGGANVPRGDHSFHCPACQAPNFKVNLVTGKWDGFSCDCASTEAGKRRIRDAISPAVNPDAKPPRQRQERHWDYFTAITQERGEPALTVHRLDDPDQPDGNGWKGGRKIWQQSRIDGFRPAEITPMVLPYGLAEAKQALTDGAPYVFWVEGEPCVDALRTIGLQAVTSIGGSGKFKPDRDAGHIPSNRLVVVPDRDKCGLDHAEKVAASHPGCQWLYAFPGTPQWNGSCPARGGLDIADWIALGATVEQILAGIGRKQQGAPDKPAVVSNHRPDPSRSEAQKLGFTELLEQALVAIRAKDIDTEMALRAEIMSRFKRSDPQITAALFRLLTEQETGKPAGSTINAEALDLDSIEGMDALLDGFIPANDLGLMYGAKGSGKTLAALAMAFAAIDGTGFLDHSKPAHQVRVLFIASDSGATPLKAAMHDLGVADHPAIKGEDRSFFVWAHSTSQGMESWCASINGCVQLLQFVKTKGIKLVLIDSAKTICAKAGISYLDNDSIAALLTFIKEAICPHTSVMILSHDGTEKGTHSGAKVWAEVPSIVHNIQQVPDAPQERVWKVVKSRMGSLRELRYQVGEDGGLEACAGVETIQDATAAVLQVLTDAAAKGITSLSRSALLLEIGQRFRFAPKTIDNTLQQMAKSQWPQICRVPSKRGHYRLAPRLIKSVSPNSASPKEEVQGKNLVIESDLLSTREVGKRYSNPQPESPSNPQYPGVGYSANPSPEQRSDPLPTLDREMPIGKSAGVSSPSLLPWQEKILELRRMNPNALPAVLVNQLGSLAGSLTGRQVKQFLESHGPSCLPSYGG